MAADDLLWSEYNQRYLTSALAQVRGALEQHAARVRQADEAHALLIEHSAGGAIERAGAPTGEGYSQNANRAPAALELLVAAFGLSPFEREILLLCAGMELDATFAGLCAQAQGDGERAYPTFGLALSALTEPHWSALTPDAPLRRWRLVEFIQPSGASLTRGALRIDERILHFLTGLQYLDERLVGLVEPIRSDLALVPSYAAIARQIELAWQQAGGGQPLIQLCGGDRASRRAIAAAGCQAVGFHLCAIAADHVPATAGEMEGLVRLWEREAILTAGALYVEAEDVDRSDARQVAAVSRLLEQIHAPLLLGTDERWRSLLRSSLTLEVTKPSPQEQREVWQTALGTAIHSMNGHRETNSDIDREMDIDELVSQFDLSVPAIQASVRMALASAVEGEALAPRLWDAGRGQARPRLDNLAQRIESKATWEDLVLPEAELRTLREIAAHVAQRTTVYEHWGFAAKSSRGLGISALFAGPSGTGKTMAAEVLAHTLRLDLYRIDLSSVVSKYIGETEKNLKRVFDTAEEGGAILFFDEADALFGKRSEVKDSHDRYANIEISYLLQRMESYRGLSVLATNMKGALDQAFLRRLRFVINFPFPDLAQRAAIWQRIFPPSTPTEGLDFGKLARLNVPGGNIRNIALNAAFLAAAAGEPVRMSHLLHAARAEYSKLEKPLTATEIGDRP